MKAALMIFAWLGLLALVLPTGDNPLFDDWVYAWSARQLAGTGVFDLPELSAAYPLFQVLWGALFLGLPFAPDLALRVSTLVLASAGTVAWYLLLRRSGRSQQWTLLIVAAGLANPVYIVLAPTFMTDVAFVALCQLALLAMLCWSERPGTLRLIACIAVVLAAAFTRQPGLALAAGLLAAAIYGRRWTAAVAALAALVAVLAGQRVFTAEIGAALPLTERFGDIGHLFRVSPLFYADGMTTVLAYIGLSAAPVALALGRPDWRLWSLWGAYLAVAWLLWGPPLLRSGTVWGACELGGARSLLAGLPPDCGWRTMARLAALLVSSAGLAAVTARVPALIGGCARALRARDLFATAAAVAVATMAAGLLGLWMFADRYWLLFGLLVPVVLAGPGQRPPPRMVMLGASLLMAVYLGTGLMGARDSFAVFRDAQSLARELAALGSAGAAQVDAGYAVNAKIRYLEMPPAPGGQGRNASVPWVSAVAASRLTVANRVEPGWRPLGRERGGLVAVAPLGP